MTPEEFHEKVLTTALATIDQVEAGEAPMDMETFKHHVAEVVEALHHKMHLLHHAGIHGDEAMLAIALAQSCDLYRYDDVDIPPEELAVTLYMAQQQHEILFPEEYIDDLAASQEEGDHE